MISFREKNSNELRELLQKQPGDYLPYFAMSVFQNITLLFRNLDNLTNQIADIFEPILVDFYSEQKHQLSPLLDNSFNHYLTVNKTNWPHIDLAVLLMQIKFSIIFSNSDLLVPLKELITSPKLMVCSFWLFKDE